MKVKIEKLTYGGRGIGSVNGKKIFVKGGLPGDVIEIIIERSKKHFSEALINNLIIPSKNRVEPECKYFYDCGGCHWQNLDYEIQLEQKEQILKDCLERIGGFKYLEIDNIQRSGKQYKYRNRITLTTWYSDEKLNLGYFREASSEKVRIEECVVATDEINENLNNILQMADSGLFKDISIEKLVLTSGFNNSSSSFFSPTGSDRNKLADILSNSAAENPVCVYPEEKMFKFFICGYEFKSVPSVFIQSNPEINELIITDIINYIKNNNINRMIDLYCGIGNISIPSAEYVNQIVGVDINLKSIKLARINQDLNNIDNIYFYCSGSEEFLENLVSEKNDIELIVVDPPREGAKTIIKNILKLEPNHIIYLSCDPSTLSRDLKQIISYGYTFVKIKPYDMFPNTFHIETLVFMKKL